MMEYKHIRKGSSPRDISIALRYEDGKHLLGVAINNPNTPFVKAIQRKKAEVNTFRPEKMLRLNKEDVEDAGGTKNSLIIIKREFLEAVSYFEMRSPNFFKGNNIADKIIFTLESICNHFEELVYKHKNSRMDFLYRMLNNHDK